MRDPVDALFGTPQMAAVFSGEAHVRRLLAFEAALARAEAGAGAIPAGAAREIEAACRLERFDVSALYDEGAAAGTVVIPLVRRLTELVEGDARRYVHWGATSQDAIDTATVLQAREGLQLIVGDLNGLGAACAGHAERHRRTVLAGRTLLQQALPITFGLKAARWLALVTRLVRRLHELGRQALVAQLGGAAGTLAALGGRGIRVMELLAEELGLAAPDLPWHAERDRVAELAAVLGLVAGGMAKIAGDVSLLAQTEVGEASEGPAGEKGGSSTLPHKRNPVDAVAAGAAARLAAGQVSVILGAMAHEHERAAGAWQAEWTALPALFQHTACAVARVRGAVEGLRISPERMRANLDAAGGLVMAESLATALAARVGRAEGYRIAQAAARRAAESNRTLHDAAVADPEVLALLSGEALARALDPAAYLGSSDALIDRALDGYAALALAPARPARHGERA